ncbi:I78 family peptidase inhibitor [Brevundimonas sp.]|uniref:I78 family peptidase inhibitor n=1 Tax=Brevundimonas sp. TaxID=1871086 RepID=UPI002D443342|nr:I78 family peptidase inhibitor [Brevundimonas sp.]HYD27114.1 I78 family peptidase inhibitor [Brevundimonas sp.]
MKIQLLSLAAAGLLIGACAPVDSGDAPMPPDDGPSRCKADQYQRFIGRNRSELPPNPANETWRVTCTTCPVTMDYNPGRLNILYEQSTGIIREVKCG